MDVDDSFEERDALALALREGRADVAIVQLPAGPGLQTRDYVADSYVLVAPKSVSLRTPLSWDQLDGLPYLQLDCAGALAIAALCREAGFAAPPARTLATDSGIAAMAARGLGYSILPRLAVHPLPDGCRCCRCRSRRNASSLSRRCRQPHGSQGRVR